MVQHHSNLQSGFCAHCLWNTWRQALSLLHAAPGYRLFPHQFGNRAAQVLLCEPWPHALIVALGIIQSIAGPRFLNPAVMADDIRLLSETYRSAPISGAIVYRPTSVFVSAGRFADMLIVA